MKRVLALFSVTALLLVSLAGCGQNTGSTGTGSNGSGGATQNGSTNSSGNAAKSGGMTSNSGTNVTGSVIDGRRNTNATANAQLRGNSRSATGTISTPGTMLDGDEQYRRMLANAHVHDTDGYLLDGENAQYVTW